MTHRALIPQVSKAQPLGVVVGASVVDVLKVVTWIVVRLVEDVNVVNVVDIEEVDKVVSEELDVVALTPIIVDRADVVAIPLVEKAELLAGPDVVEGPLVVDAELVVGPDVVECPLVVEPGLLVGPDEVEGPLVAVHCWMYGLLEMVPLTE